MKKSLFIIEGLLNIAFVISFTALLILQNTVSYEMAGTFEKTPKSSFFVIMQNNPVWGYVLVGSGTVLAIYGIVRIFRMVKAGKKRPKTDYDIYLENLLDTVKRKGILVEVMEPGTSCLSVRRDQYKKNLGAVPVKNIFGNITNVYVVYEDYDGSIKYYDYPERTRKQAARILKEKNYEEYR